ncbi:MAG: flagellin [Waltera sp.]|uniref:flagellin N-terminal helical domain-containing protein n=1 Tax=Waltera sp. TaxID=2815806 RepID=UPI0039939ACD
MVVQHNLTAMNSNRMLGLTTASQAKSTEKLSSGYKINRAADDAAGLSISEKMRKQIRGLTQASLNAQDGISAVQTAEGALTEVHDMLQRMNELAVKASNGTNSEDDRSYIQNEIDQLVTEIDRVSTTTKFNETYLLQGNARGTVSATPADQTVDSKLADVKLNAAAGSELVAGDVVLGKVTAEVENNQGGALIGNLSGSVLNALNDAKAGKITITQQQDAGKNVDQYQVKGGADGTTVVATLTQAQLKKMGVNITDGGAGVAGEMVIQLKWNQTEQKDLQAGLSIDAAADKVTADKLKASGLKVGDEVKVTIKAEQDATTGNTVTKLKAYDNAYVPDALNVSLHVGADSSNDNKIEMSIESMSSKSLGLVDEDGKLLVDGKDSTNADKAIDTIAQAIQKVSTQRSALGAVQNRLEHTVNNLDNVVENTTSAESQIRDTDMATEMVKYSNNNILSQAGQAMLAQANQSNQGVLSLLQ